MNGTRIQQLIWAGLGKAAARVGFPCAVYRSTTLLSPISSGNLLLSNFYVSFTTGYDYSKYQDPKKQYWTAVLDGRQVAIGDWIIAPEATFFIADIQETLPIPAVRCNRIISISRPAWSTSGPLQPTNQIVATAMPAFMYSARIRGKLPAGFPDASETVAGMPEVECHINARGAGVIQKNDIVTDELGTQYVVETYNPTASGYILVLRIEKP